MSGITRLLAATLALSALAPTTSASAQTMIEAPAGDWRLPGHPRVVFPDAVDGYRRLHVIRYGDDDHSVSYRRQGPDNQDALVSLYVYRAGGSCDAEFAGNKAALVDRFTGARQVRETGPDAVAGGTTRSVRFAGPIPADIASRDGLTELTLFCDTATLRAVKIRATTNVDAWIDDAATLLAAVQLIERVERR